MSPFDVVADTVANVIAVAIGDLGIYCWIRDQCRTYSCCRGVKFLRDSTSEAGRENDGSNAQLDGYHLEYFVILSESFNDRSQLIS